VTDGQYFKYCLHVRARARAWCVRPWERVFCACTQPLSRYNNSNSNSNNNEIKRQNSSLIFACQRNPYPHEGGRFRTEPGLNAPAPNIFFFSLYLYLFSSVKNIDFHFQWPKNIVHSDKSSFSEFYSFPRPAEYCSVH
jgi:hypothetical protein